MIDAPQIVQSPRQRTAAIHVKVARDEIQQVFAPAVNELLKELSVQNVAPAGALLSYYATMPGELFDFDIAFPVAQDIEPAGRVVASEVPAMKVARTIYRGPMEGIGSAWGELEKWIAANGDAGRPRMFERYLVGPGDTADPSKWQTELNWQVAD